MACPIEADLTPSPELSERIVLAPQERLPCVLELIRSARNRLVLSLFRCNDYGVLEALGEALGRGVRVQVLTTQRAKRWKERLEALWSSLEAIGAEVYRYSDPVVKYHAKYIIADDQRALVASLNFTKKCFKKTSDLILVTSDRTVIAGLGALFTNDSRLEYSAMPDTISDRLIVGPERARAQVCRWIEGASHSIRIIDHKATDPAILDLLQARKAEGLEVEILSRRKLGELRSHGKLILIDDRLAVIGSMSLAAISLEHRRELALVIADPTCVGELSRFYRSVAAEVGANRKESNLQ